MKKPDYQYIKKLFSKDGKYSQYYPIYEAVDSFLFGSALKTKTAPHIRDGVDLKRIMITVILALIPCTFMGIWNTGYQANLAMQSLGMENLLGWRGSFLALTGSNPESFLSNFWHGLLYFLPIYLTTLLVGSFWEALFNLLRGHEFSEAFLVSSLLFTLILPAGIPLWQVALGISFGVVFAKEVFGGVGRNFMNPALAARAFIFFSYPAQITGNDVWIPIDGISSATPLSMLANQQIVPDHLWLEAFWGTTAGCIGETSTMACLLGAAILLYTRIASWRIMLSMTLGALFCGLLYFLFADPENIMATIPPHYHLILGGFAFGLVFMATDPVSAAQTLIGQWFYGFFVGFIVILIRVQNPAYIEGVMLAILLGNVFAPLFDYCVIQANIRRRKKRHV